MLSAVVLTKKIETKNFKRCLKSLDFVDEIIVVVDKENIKYLNQQSKIKIFYNHFNNNFSDQRNFGMAKAKGDWILFLDDDEEITYQLKKEIIKALKSDHKHFAYYIKRRDFFWGREVFFGELKKARNNGIIRLVKKNSGCWHGSVHEEFKLNSNQYLISRFSGFINHYPHQTLKEFINDINFYSSLRAEELKTIGKKTNIFEIIFFPFFKFILTYFIYLGFLDGPVGFVYSFMMSFHSFLVRAKLYLMTNN
ncbi:MAG: glycosyltransferase family 2 protein [Candidatus Microgenomates bacterium]